MERRSLVALALVEQSSPIIGLDNKPLMTEPGVRSAIQRVARDLEDMRQARGLTEANGWTAEEPPATLNSEHNIAFALIAAVNEDDWEPNGEYAVRGQMIVRRD